MVQLGWWTWRNGVITIGHIRKRRNLIVPPGQIVELLIGLAYGMVAHSLAFLTRPADTEYDHLFIGNGLALGESIDRLVFELRCQNRSAVVDAIIRNDHHKSAARPNPPPDVLQEQPFH